MEKGREGFQIVKNKFLGMTYILIFTILIVVMVAQVNVYVITFQTYTLCMFTLLYFVYCQLHLSNEKKKTLPFIISCIMVEDKTVWEYKKKSSLD